MYILEMEGMRGHKHDIGKLWHGIFYWQSKLAFALYIFFLFLLSGQVRLHFVLSIDTLFNIVCISESTSANILCVFIRSQTL